MVSETASGTGVDAGDRRRRALLAVLALAAVVALVVWWFLAQLTTVPDVTGMTRSQAEERLGGAGFELGEVVSVTAFDKAEPGTVMQQTPSAGEHVPLGAKVALVLAKESDETTTPAPASSMGLVDDDYLDIPEDVREVDDVELAPESPPLASGPQVPSVLGKTGSDARSVLSSAGYGVRVAYGPSTTSVPTGLVYKQDPAPEAYEPHGAPVTIWLSTGTPR